MVTVINNQGPICLANLTHASNSPDVAPCIPLLLRNQLNCTFIRSIKGFQGWIWHFNEEKP